MAIYVIDTGATYGEVSASIHSADGSSRRIESGADRVTNLNPGESLHIVVAKPEEVAAAKGNVADVAMDRMFRTSEVARAMARAVPDGLMRAVVGDNQRSR